MACEWERSYNAMHCPCLYILSAWMHFLFTTTILMKKIISLSIHLLSIALFRNSPLTDSRIWLYTSEIHVHIFRDEKACIMTSRYFTLAKNDFMSDWKLLDAVNGNDGSSYPFRTEKKKKGNAYTPCQKHLQHSRYACNWSERHLTPAVQLRDIPQDKYDMAECHSRWKAFISKCFSPYCLCCKPLDDRECDLTEALYNLQLRWNIWLFRNI